MSKTIISLSASIDDVKRIDKLAELAGMSRSEYMVRASTTGGFMFNSMRKEAERLLNMAKLVCESMEGILDSLNALELEAAKIPVVESAPAPAHVGFGEPAPAPSKKKLSTITDHWVGFDLPTDDDIKASMEKDPDYYHGWTLAKLAAERDRLAELNYNHEVVDRFLEEKGIDLKSLLDSSAHTIEFQEVSGWTYATIFKMRDWPEAV